ncbi:MAG: methyltransferase domain-containing protein [Deltaproteobacteria bacterium]|nr:methyltransferase domain-containing protein [Deltaproteobacteria bacterium]
MSFYSSISNYYDLIFPISAEQENFFAELVRDFKPRRVLDAACGSGSQLLCFAKRGLSCAGFDSDPEMVTLARKKFSVFDDVAILEGTFDEMKDMFEPGFDLIMNIGNSLVHVPRDDAGKFIRDAADLLNNEGMLLIQILNYDRIFEQKIEELPLITVSSHDISFRRSYTFTSNEKVIFKTIVEVPSKGITISNSLPLFPIKKDRLITMIQNAGLHVMGIFPGFVGKKYTAESDALVVLAKK